MSNKNIKLAIMASGNGSNAEAIIRHFANHHEIEVATIYTNNESAFVLERANRNDIKGIVFTKEEFLNPSFYQQVLLHQYDLIILAGFMWLIPAALIGSYRNRIINIHPALLPKYGGKGMYGSYVHKAVIENKENESGITIHYVNEKYDDGDIIFQTNCKVLATDSPASLAERIHILEHRHYPVEIEKLCNKLLLSQ